VYSNHANWLGNRGDGGGTYNANPWAVTVVHGGVTKNYLHKPWGVENNIEGQPVRSYHETQIFGFSPSAFWHTVSVNPGPFSRV
jgi:hypothetical protein